MNAVVGQMFAILGLPWGAPTWPKHDWQGSPGPKIDPKGGPQMSPEKKGPQKGPYPRLGPFWLPFGVLIWVPFFGIHLGSLFAAHFGFR